MVNWQIALITETQRRQEQIADAEIDRMIKLAYGRQSTLRRVYQAILLVLANTLIETGTRLQNRYTQLTTPSTVGAEASPCS